MKRTATFDDGYPTSNHPPKNSLSTIKSRRFFFLVVLLFIEIAIGLYQNEIKVAVAGAIDQQPMLPLAHEFNCDFCHNMPKGTPPNSRDIKLSCTKCHKDTAMQVHIFADKDSEDCLRCHQMHAQTPRLLRAPVELLCQTCHRDQAIRLQEGEHASLQSGELGSCMTCHDAHDAPYEKHLKANPIETCRKCHSGSESIYNHPVGGDLIDETTGEELTCTSTCHDTHGTGKPHLLRLEDSDGLCYQCHQLEELS